MLKGKIGKERKLFFSRFFIFCIGIGCLLHITPYLYNRSLWVDEAMLASSICTRPLSELAADPLDFGQSASLGWLYIVKILTICFGTSEFILRVWSLITAFGCICLFYFLLKNRVQKNFALFFTAVFSLCDQFIYYGNECKPYMSDNFFGLLAVLLWQKYKEKKISLLHLAVGFSIILFFSFSAVFLIAGCMIIECIRIAKAYPQEKISKTARDMGKCFVVLFGFLLYYVVWLSKSAGNAGVWISAEEGTGAENYWKLLRFPLIPKSLSDIKLILRMAVQFFSFLPKGIAVITCGCFVVYACIAVKEKKDRLHIFVPFLISLLLIFIASYMGFYPISSRLLQLYTILLLAFAAFSCDKVYNILLHINTSRNMDRKNLRYVYCTILMICLAFTGMGGCKNLFGRHVYINGSEIELSVQYLSQNVKQSDVIYVYAYSIPVYLYEKNYETTFSELCQAESMPYQKGNTIYGQTLIRFFYKIPYSYDGEIRENAAQKDADMILQNESVYIFTSHDEYAKEALLARLESFGTVEVVCESHGTELYHFQRMQS